MENEQDGVGKNREKGGVGLTGKGRGWTNRKRAGWGSLGRAESRVGWRTNFSAVAFLKKIR